MGVIMDKLREVDNTFDFWMSPYHQGLAHALDEKDVRVLDVVSNRIGDFRRHDVTDQMTWAIIDDILTAESDWPVSKPVYHIYHDKSREPWPWVLGVDRYGGSDQPEIADTALSPWVCCRTEEDAVSLLDVIRVCNNLRLAGEKQ